MAVAGDLSQRLQDWDRAAWCLASIALALRADASPEMSAAASELLSAVGLDTADWAHGSADQLASTAAAPLHITSAVLSGTGGGWGANTVPALLAQGHASAQVARGFARFGLPHMDDLGERLARPGARMLDVGTGVGAIAIAFAEEFPQLHVLGIDVLETALDVAAEYIAASTVADRVAVRKQDLADFSDTGDFDLVWIPAPFIPAGALRDGLPRVVAALRPGGWLSVGHGKFGEDSAADALNRLKTIAFGGTPLDTHAAQALLHELGLVSISTLPTPPGAPAVTIGRTSSP